MYNWLNENTEISIPIYNLLRSVVVTFPRLESLEAVRGFVYGVGKTITETVVAEKERLAKRTKNPKRLGIPLLRAIRHVRDYYLTDVRDHPDDQLLDRTPRWAREMKTLPAYQGSKLDAPSPVTLTWEYEFLRGLCAYIKSEMGFERWKDLAQELPQDPQTPLSIPIPFWPKGEYLEVNIPDNATPEEAAFLILSAKMKLSSDRLRKLVQEGRRLFPQAALKAIERLWEKAYINPKLGIIRVPTKDQKDELVLDLSELTIKNLF